MSAVSRKPWPMRWIVVSILLFLVPYTFITLHYRKPNKAFEPYADLKGQANVKRLLDAGFTRLTVRAERPFPPLPRSEIVPGRIAAHTTAPAGLPRPLRQALVDLPRLPVSYDHVLAPEEISAAQSFRIQFTARLDNNREQLSGAEVYLNVGTVIIVPTFETIPEGLKTRTRESDILLTLPASLLPPGEHGITLIGSGVSLSWSLRVR